MDVLIRERFPEERDAARANAVTGTQARVPKAPLAAPPFLPVMCPPRKAGRLVNLKKENAFQRAFIERERTQLATNTLDTRHSPTAQPGALTNFCSSAGGVAPREERL